MSIAKLTDFVESTPTKIVLLVIDGFGGLPHPKTGKSELETAHLPNLSALAKDSALGLTDPVAPGITPGSGAGHLALFGYDPEAYYLKRGAMEAIGSGLDLKPGEVAARGNFCTIGPDGLIVDRRAGRPDDAATIPIIKLLNTIKVEGGSVTVYPVKEHRFAAIFRGDALSDDITNTDPEKTDVPIAEATAVTPKAEKMARMANEFTRKARQVLAGQPTMSMALMRGFSQVPDVPSMAERYKLKPACVAIYPMYRGLAYIVGMDLLNSEGTTMADEIETAKRHWNSYDFFFMHFKYADSAAEDFDFDRKVKMLEEVDKSIPGIRALGPDVIMVAGDHSTPAILGGHSWHPVPFLMHGPFCGNGGIAEFNERACARGMLGRMPARYAMALALANAGKLNKFGA